MKNLFSSENIENLLCSPVYLVPELHEQIFCFRHSCDAFAGIWLDLRVYQIQAEKSEEYKADKL